MLNTVGRLLSAAFFEHPIFVVGTGRSGTSVLLQALGHHPRILDMPGEAPFLTTIGNSAYLFEEHEDRKYYNDSIKLQRDYFDHQLRRLGFEVAAGSHYGARLLMKGLLGRGNSPIGRRFWAAKTFPAEEAARGFLKLYPGVKFIYIVRNGCDVVQSMTKYSGFSDRDFEEHCRRWAGGVEKYRYLTQLPEAILVRQENLLSEPEAFFEKLHTFLNLETSQAPLEFVTTTLVHPLDKKTVSGVDPLKELRGRKRAIADWTSGQRTLFSDICSKGMKELGYHALL